MVNRVILVGRLGKDVELRHTNSGAAVASFSIATSERYTDKSGEKQEKTEWHNVVLWSKLAEIANSYLSKGSLVYIEGRLQTRSWDDKEGKKRYTTEVVGNIMQMLDRKGESGDGQQGNRQAPQQEGHSGQPAGSSHSSGGFSTPSENSGQGGFGGGSDSGSFGSDEGDIPF